VVDEVGIDEDFVWWAEGLVVLEEEVGGNLWSVGELVMYGNSSGKGSDTSRMTS